MSTFSKLLATLKGLQNFPQPFRRNALIALLFVCAVSPQYIAAQTGGRIAGAVKDATGAVIPNGQVVLVNPANGVKQSVTTGNDGVFTFAAVPVGQYELDVKADGFNPYRQTTNLKIDVNTALTVDVVLQVAANQTVNVIENTAEVTHGRYANRTDHRKHADGRYSAQWAVAIRTCSPYRRVSPR